MNIIDLTKTLKPYKSGWVAVNKKRRVVAYAESFASIAKKVKRKRGLLLVPASENYFGFVT